MQIELLNFPVDRFQQARQHANAVQRELDVLRMEGARAGRIPRNSDEVVADLDARFTGYRSTMDTLDDLVQQGAGHPLRLGDHEVVAGVELPEPALRPRLLDHRRVAGRDRRWERSPSPVSVGACTSWPAARRMRASGW